MGGVGAAGGRDARLVGERPADSRGPVLGLDPGVLWTLWHLPLLWTDGAPLYQQPFWLLLLDLLA